MESSSVFRSQAVGMWPCCCSSLTCADVCREIRMFPQDQEDRSGVRMDVELLKEQYRENREKQRRETRVVCFRKALNSDTVKENDVVLPTCRIKTSVPESPSDSLADPWPSHLDVCRPPHMTAECVIRHTADSDTSTEGSSSSSESERLSEDLNRSVMENRTGPNSRKFSAPAALSRQLSFGSYRSTPADSRNYPFPQRKSLRKSETARRLGMYASL